MTGSDTEHAIRLRLEDILADSGPEETRDLVTVFLADAEATLACLARAWDARDAEDFASRLHALCGSCRCLGLERLANFCARLEKTVAQDGLAAGAPLWQAVKQRYPSDKAKLLQQSSNLLP